MFSVLRSSASLLSIRAVKPHNRMSSSHHPRAALCQLSVTVDKLANFCATRELLEEAKRRGAAMAFLPEAFDYIGSSREETLELSETLAGDTIAQYAQMARYETSRRIGVKDVDKEKKFLAELNITFLRHRKLDMWLSLGGFHERGRQWEAERRIYNCHVVMNNQGEIVSTYRKCHLFDVELPEKGVLLSESTFTIPGPSLVAPVQTPIGKVSSPHRRVRLRRLALLTAVCRQLGLGVCYDLRFPEFSLALQKSGAEILTFPSAFTEVTGAAHWEVLLRARAIENQCYVLAAAQVGRHHDRRSSYGHALAVDPWGAVTADCGGERAGLALVEVDLEKVRSVRRNMPLQKHRRDDNFYASV